MGNDAFLARSVFRACRPQPPIKPIPPRFLRGGIGGIVDMRIERFFAFWSRADGANEKCRRF
jgi:hypothetical protein